MNRRLLTIAKINKVLRREITQAGGPSQWARRTGISRAHISRVLHGHRQPGPEMIRGLGLQEVGQSKDVLRILSDEIDKAVGQSEWARRMGANRTTLNSNCVINGRMKPGLTICR
jgi:DNA-binding phage protein